MGVLLAEGMNEPLVESALQGIAQGTALKNVSADNDKDLMFMAGSGYCEGVIGRFKETDVDFATAPATLARTFSSTKVAGAKAAAPPVPLKSRSRAGSATSTSSDKRTGDAENITSRIRKKSSAHDMTRSSSSSKNHTTVASGSTLDPSTAELVGPRKLTSEENLEDNSSGLTAAPVIPPRSSSRQSKGSVSQKQSSGVQSLVTKSSASSVNSLADPHGSSASFITNSLEIKSNELTSASLDQRSRPPSRKNSACRTTAPHQQSSEPVVPSHDDRGSTRQQRNSNSHNYQKQLELDHEHLEHNHYLSSVLEDIRSKTHEVLQKTGFSMSPTAGLYADRGSKELDMTVVQMPLPPDATAATSASEPTLPLNIKTTSSALASSTTSSVSFAISAPDVGNAMSGSTGTSVFSVRNDTSASSRSSRDDNGPLQSSPLSATSVASSPESSAHHSVFDRLKPWSTSERRQRSNSGPARHSDSSLQQKIEEHQVFRVQSPQLESIRVSRQRRPSETTSMTVNSVGTTYSCPPHDSLSAEHRGQAQVSRNRSKHWFGIGRRASAHAVEDTRKPHPLGHGIEGGIVARHLSSLLRDDEDGEDSDGQEEDEDLDLEGRKSGETPRLYINDFGFIYDLDDETIQGQDLTGNGSSVGASGPLGSTVSTMSEVERKKDIKKQKHNRENELKWIHAVTTLQADNVRKSSKYKKLARRGVPASVRGRVWLFLAKADLYRQPGLFEELCKRGSLPIHEVIERDIHRCYPDHVHFRDGMDGTGQQDLHAILKAYAHYKPSVGYCQGMGRLVGMMLMQMPVEDAFWLLVATIEGYMQDYYIPSLRQLRIDAQVFERLLKDQDPPLAEHLLNNDVIPLMYMTQWFMTLYTMSLPWASVLRVWDVFYFDGVKALFRVGLAIMQLCRDHLLNKCPTSSELLAYILHIPLDILAPKPLLEAALQIKLKKQSVEKLIAVTAVSMDAAAAATTSASRSASKSVRKSVHTTTISTTTTATVTTSNNHTNNNKEQDIIASTSNTNSNNSDSKLPRRNSQPTSSDTNAASPTTSSGPSSFSPLNVFKTRKRAGTISK
ncbi:hypothetical protein BGZ99_005754 [Dissophora globulifera]|uniref:Rab-GAP TBC domain-containing protein n=1 Tax=Dissophora globulifera TaxID=979702 RepID=A0A9P6UT03_9FUNG|nr:hypothetical protein BGZ99_005754 [Dissophora globulifera]